MKKHMNKAEDTLAPKQKKKWNPVTLLLIAGLGGIFLIGIAPMLSAQDKKSEAVSSAPEAITTDEYAEKLEVKLKNILGQIDGVGRVEVMVTLKNGYSYRYAVTEKKGSDVSEDIRSEEERKTVKKNTTEQSYVLVEGDSGSEPLITAMSEPEVQGVIVVCDGGDNAVVKSKVTEAVKVALDLSSAKITVSKRCASDP